MFKASNYFITFILFNDKILGCICRLFFYRNSSTNKIVHRLLTFELYTWIAAIFIDICRFIEVFNCLIESVRLKNNIPNFVSSKILKNR